MSNRISKGRYGDDNDPKIIEAERRRLEADEQFNQLPEFMSRPEAFNDPSENFVGHRCLHYPSVCRPCSINLHTNS
jgi:hypothetical protein